MAKTVEIRVDPERSSLEVASGRLFLGTVSRISLDGWLPNAGCEPVLTMFPHDRGTPLAQSRDEDGVLVLDLTGAALRRAFHCAPARHQFALYLNQRDSSGKYLPDVEAVGTVFVDWSPEVFDVVNGDVATLQGPPGNPGADGLSAYELAVANGYRGTLTQWLESLKGAPGRDGVPGADGSDGIDGLSAFGVAVKNGFSGTEAEWLASLKGKDGKGSNIKESSSNPGNAARADIAENAHYAESASDAGSAVYAERAGNADNAKSADAAVSAKTAETAKFAAYANLAEAASTASRADEALHANSAESAVMDSAGNVISETYVMKSSVGAAVELSGEYEDGTAFSFNVLTRGE